MKTGTIPYRSLEHTLKGLKVQVQDSMPYIGDYVPDTITSPKELFYYLRDLVIYKNDPKGKELLQTVQTLFEESGGKGDCDCFTILSLASFYYLGFLPAEVILVSKHKHAATHIYTQVYDDGEMKAFDLTNPTYGMERSYKYKQTLPFNMTLELRDGGSSALGCRTLRDRYTGATYMNEGLAGKKRRERRASKSGGGESYSPPANSGSDDSDTDDGTMSFGGRTRARHNARNAGRIGKINAKYAGKEETAYAKQEEKAAGYEQGIITGPGGGDGGGYAAPEDGFNPDSEPMDDANLYPALSGPFEFLKKGKKAAVKEVAKEVKQQQQEEAKKDSIWEKIQRNPVETAVIGGVVAYFLPKVLDKVFSHGRRRA